jgi:hypothetical protein
VTFLFTDVEGSTRRWEADAEGMRVALAAHDEVLRAAIEGHGGWLFKHTGDGVCAAFASPRSAIDAAVSAQRGLELPVRMGLATGEAESRGADYFGAVQHSGCWSCRRGWVPHPRGTDQNSATRERAAPEESRGGPINYSVAVRGSAAAAACLSTATVRLRC